MNEGLQFPFLTAGRQRSLKANELESLLELLPHAAVLVDSQSWKVLFANSKAAELTLYTRKELTGVGMASLIAGWDEKSIHHLEKDPASFGKVSALKNRLNKNLIRGNHTYLPVQLYFAPFPFGENRSIVAIRSTESSSDLFNREDFSHFWESLSALQDAPQEYDLSIALGQTLEAASRLTRADLLAVYQASDQSPALYRSASYGKAHLLPEQLSAQDLIQLKKPEYWASGKRAKCSLHRVARSANMSYLATATIGPSHALSGLVVLADTQTAPPDYILQFAQLLATTIHSILQRQGRVHQLQSELHEKELQLSVFETLEQRIHEGVLVLDPSLQVHRMNQSAEVMLGYANREVTGQSVDKVLIGAESVLHALIAAQQGSATYSLGGVRLYRRDGEAFQATLRIFPVMNHERLEAILVFVQDLSEQELIRLHAEQLEQRAMLGEVTAIFAHEVRNPINNISTGLQLMALSLPKNDPNQESVTRMLQDCDRLAELIKSVLAFSRTNDYEMEVLDLPVLLQRLLERLKPRISRLNIRHDLQVEPGCLPINGNLHALEQVFNNLITNALQVMSETGGSLVVKAQPVLTSEGRNCIEVSVADTGPGIPKELQERVFQPFFTTDRNGTGLGLAIAKRIVTAHRGTIRLTSFPGGTIFHVQIPVAENKS